MREVCVCGGFVCMKEGHGDGVCVCKQGALWGTKRANTAGRERLCGSADHDQRPHYTHTHTQRERAQR